jgi:sec-independent protein translocase protein TatB
MFNVGGPEVMVILLVALIVLGPQQLPKAIRSVTNVMNELRKVSSGFQSEMQKVMDIGATDTTGREVRSENRTSQPTPGPGSAVADPSTSDDATTHGDGTAHASTDASPGPEPAAVDPADRAAG